MKSIVIEGGIGLCGGDDPGWVWYTIERAVHDGKRELVTERDGLTLYYAGRISDADVEGDADDMRHIALAIREKRQWSAKRCAVKATQLFDSQGDEIDLVEFYSPRNSQRIALVTREAAEDLAQQIEEKLGPLPESEAS